MSTCIYQCTHIYTHPHSHTQIRTNINTYHATVKTNSPSFIKHTPFQAHPHTIPNSPTHPQIRTHTRTPTLTHTRAPSAIELLRQQRINSNNIYTCLMANASFKLMSKLPLLLLGFANWWCQSVNEINCCKI